MGQKRAKSIKFSVTFPKIPVAQLKIAAF
jgi:hypothetical protein